LNEKVAIPFKKTELTFGGSVALTTRHALSAKVGTLHFKWLKLFLNKRQISLCPSSKFGFSVEIEKEFHGETAYREIN
jgi:hypothetical protein